MPKSELDGILPNEGCPPWHHGEVSYAGWVPTILGHLSFSIIGRKKSWFYYKNYNDVDEERVTRYVGAHQKRTAQDFPFWNALVRIFRPAATQDYFLVAKTTTAYIPYLDGESPRTVADRQGALAGYVFVIPHEKKRNKNRAKNSILKRIQSKLNSTSVEPKNFQHEILPIFEELSQKGIFFHRMKFSLFRTGEIRLWATESDLIADLPNSSETADTILKNLPKQIYYFIKDSAHNHYHHDPTLDQVLPLVPQKPMSDEITDDIELENEISWRREVLWGLARVLARFRRGRNIQQLKSAEGVLSYADAFQATLGRLRRKGNLDQLPEYNKEMTLYDFAHARQSVRALETLRSWKNNGALQLVGGVVAIIISAITFWATSVRITGLYCETAEDPIIQYCKSLLSDRALFVTAWIADHPLIFTATLIAPIVVIYSIFVRDLSFLRIAKSFTRTLMRFAQALGTSVSRRLRKPIIGFLFTQFVLFSIVSIILYWAFQVASVMHVE